MPDRPIFDATFRGGLDRLFAWRRDVRRFEPQPVPEDVMAELIASARHAPSVGLSQPWRLVRVRDAQRRAQVRGIFEACNADALARQPESRAALYARLKLSGMDEAPEHVAVFADDDTPTGGGLGRATMPETLGYSAVLAIHTLWLAAAARGVGVGWVSIVDPAKIAEALDVPPHWRLIGYLCIGYPREASDTPELERAGWEHRRPAADFLLER